MLERLHLSFVIPGLVPGIHVDGRIKSGHDDGGIDKWL
jgi:hypothetical protein